MPPCVGVGASFGGCIVGADCSDFVVGGLFVFVGGGDVAVVVCGGGWGGDCFWVFVNMSSLPTGC